MVLFGSTEPYGTHYFCAFCRYKEQHQRPQGPSAGDTDPRALMAAADQGRSMMTRLLARKLSIGELLQQEGLLTPAQLARGLAVQKTQRPARPLGQICVELGFLSETALGNVVCQHRQRLLLGEWLVHVGVITLEQLHMALEQLRQPGPKKKLGSLLVENGWLDEHTLERLLTPVAPLTDLSAQQLFRKFEALVVNDCLSAENLQTAIAEAHAQHLPVETVLQERYQISKQEIGYALHTFYQCPFLEYDDKREIAADLVHGINPSYLKASSWVPLQANAYQVEILIDDPLATDRLQDIQRLFPGKTIRCLVGLREDILQYVQDVSTSRTFSSLPETLPTLFDESLDDAKDATIDENNSVIVRLVNQLIIDAYKRGASDIHIEPNGPNADTSIRFRVDGDCYDYQAVPAAYRRALVSRLKILAHLDIAERRKPQDGKIKVRLSNTRELELRMATIPTAGVSNEDVVLRLLTNSRPMSLEQLQMTPRNLQAFRHVLERPYGLILCVGPTGAGKTTTLHAALAAINARKRKIWTAEDPVEITQLGLRQVQVQPKIGFTFAAAMRAFLRADPDVIMVGEIRDHETAEIGLEASLTGHLVFSTLHTNSAVETVARLLEMGMDSFNFADALLGVMAQRLARTICPHCKVGYHPSQEEYDALAATYGREAFAQLQRPYDDRFILQRGTGCTQCQQSGYKGRIGLHEFLVVTPEIRRLILARATPEALIEVARAQGMTTLLQDGILKVCQGWTDYHQVRAMASR
jgi:type II secretory ATPase GspE/PulE/Tfp pilus assembly ATPase PilB-like protein